MEGKGAGQFRSQVRLFGRRILCPSHANKTFFLLWPLALCSREAQHAKFHTVMSVCLTFLLDVYLVAISDSLSPKQHLFPLSPEPVPSTLAQ